MSNFNKTYHKGKYRNGEWAKHLRPYLKRLGNKKWRKTSNSIDENDEIKASSFKKGRKTIEVRITKKYFGDFKSTYASKYRKMRDAENAIKQANVIHAEIIKK